MYRSRTVYLCHFFFPVSEGCEEFVSIRSAASNPDQSVIQFLVGFLSLNGLFFRSSGYVNTILEKKYFVNMEWIIHSIRRGYDASEQMKFMVQILKISVRKTHAFDSLHRFFCGTAHIGRYRGIIISEVLFHLIVVMLREIFLHKVVGIAFIFKTIAYHHIS